MARYRIVTGTVARWINGAEQEIQGKLVECNEDEGEGWKVLCPLTDLAMLYRGLEFSGLPKQWFDESRRLRDEYEASCEPACQ